MRCIKDASGKVLTENTTIKEIWQRYFFELLNGEVIPIFKVRKEKVVRVIFILDCVYSLTRTRLKRP